MNIDGVTVCFEPRGEKRFRVLADGREIGFIELVRDSTELLAFRCNGTPLSAPSRWGGKIAARFGSREVAARALLSEGKEKT